MNVSFNKDVQSFTTVEAIVQMFFIMVSRSVNLSVLFCSSPPVSESLIVYYQCKRHAVAGAQLGSFERRGTNKFVIGRMRL